MECQQNEAGLEHLRWEERLGKLEGYGISILRGFRDPVRLPMSLPT